MAGLGSSAARQERSRGFFPTVRRRREWLVGLPVPVPRFDVLGFSSNDFVER
jgi:hypothetical protein